MEGTPDMKIKNLFIGDTSHTGIQFFRSLFVGGIATVVDMLVLILIRELFRAPEGLAAVFGFIAGLAVNYIISTFWVFAKAKVKNRIIDFIGFAVIGIIGLGLTQLIIEPFAVEGIFGRGLFVSIKLFGGLMPTDKYYIVGKVLAVVIVYMWNFFARKFILYRKVEEKDPAKDKKTDAKQNTSDNKQKKASDKNQKPADGKHKKASDTANKGGKAVKTNKKQKNKKK